MEKAQFALGTFMPAAWCLALLLFLCPVSGAAAGGSAKSDTVPAAQDEDQGTSTTELNKQLTNPVSSLWSIQLQQNNYHLAHPSLWQSNLQFQPVMPVALTKDWNFITRPVFQLFNSTPYPRLKNQKAKYTRTTGLGDTILAEIFSPGPSLVGNWLLGLGPTFIFPTATTKYTGQGKWQVGPAALVGYLSQKWILGGFLQNWTSFAASEGGRAKTNQMNLQPIASYFLEDGWSVGYSGNILANWEADDGDDRWTVPIGLGVNKVVKFGRLPVKLGLAVQYMPIRPDHFGQMWNIQFSFTPVLPKLIKGVLFN